MNTPDTDLDDLLDRLVAEYSDRLASGGEPADADLLAKAPPAAHAGLQRCFRMLRAGTAVAPRRHGTLRPGERLGGLELREELGRGGMAVVWRARQAELRRDVALKVLRPGLAVDPRHVDRFRREALAAARLAHPHIVAVHAVGEDEGVHWLAMELVEGCTLAQVYEALPRDRPRTAADLARAAGLPAEAFGARSFEQALCALLAPVARALATAHEVGLVHRDVKPSNILVGRDGRARIADFGLAKGDGDPALSLSGEPLGTPFYMSPEQAESSVLAVDQRTDVWSLGVTLFEGLAGRRPFEGRTPLEVLAAVRERPAPALRTLARGASRDAEAVLRRALARRPDERYASALLLAADLIALSEGQATQAALREGGALRRGMRALGALLRGEVPELRSSASLLGLPLLHVVGSGPRGRLPPVARGWIALGGRAVGVVAVGGFAAGVLPLGGFALGLVPLGGLALGVLPFAGVAAGWLAVGGLSAGWGAVGGMAWGHYALAGRAHGVHVVTGAWRDPAALDFFRPWLDWITLLPGTEALRALF